MGINGFGELEMCLLKKFDSRLVPMSRPVLTLLVVCGVSFLSQQRWWGKLYHSIQYLKIIILGSFWGGLHITPLHI
jgi:hypothetical protein